MRRTIMPVLRRLVAQRDGSSMIEMAFILPILVMLGCGAVDVASCYARQMALQQAAARTAEYAIASGFNGSTSSVLQNEAATAAGITVSTTQDTTNCLDSSNPCINLWLECDGVAQAAGTTSCASGSPSRFASVKITDTYNWMFEQLIDSWNHSPYSVTLKGYAEVRIQ
jgi:Flp pilus assembly protein TadG